MLRHRNKKKYRSLKNKKKIFRLKISDTGYAPNMDYSEYDRLRKYEGCNKVYSEHFSTRSFIAYEKSDGNIFVILDDEESRQILFCDYIRKNELNIFINSIDAEYVDNSIDAENVGISFELAEIIGKDKILINFSNGVWYRECDIVDYDYRDELICVIKDELGLHIENLDIKIGIQKTMYDW